MSFDKCIQLYAVSHRTFPLPQEIPSCPSPVKQIDQYYVFKGAVTAVSYSVPASIFAFIPEKN